MKKQPDKVYDDDDVEITARALGAEVGLKGSWGRVLIISLVLCVLMSSASVVFVAVKLHEHDVRTSAYLEKEQILIQETTSKLERSFEGLSEAINMQTCLNTLPIEVRRQELVNPNSTCYFISRQR